MENDKKNELKQLILNEIAFRSEFKKIRSELEKLVDPISKHNRKCCEFWIKNFPDTEEIVVQMDTATFKVKRPSKEDCSVETYLPYGMDYTIVDVINCVD